MSKGGGLWNLCSREERVVFLFSTKLAISMTEKGRGVYYLTDPLGDIICLRELLDVIGNCSRSPVEEGSCSTLAARERNSGLFIPAGKEFHCGESLDALRVHK